MPTPQKEKLVQEMSEKFGKATGIYLADFTGMDVNTTTELRRKFREAKVEYRVVKNTLAKLSFHQAGIEGMDEFLKGVNSYAISYDDPTLPMKVLDKDKELKSMLRIKAAYFEGKIVGPDQVEQLAKLPSRQELIGQFASMLQAPMTKLVSTLNGALVQLVGVLKALEEQKK